MSQQIKTLLYTVTQKARPSVLTQETTSLTTRKGNFNVQTAICLTTRKAMPLGKRITFQGMSPSLPYTYNIIYQTVDTKYDNWWKPIFSAKSMLFALPSLSHTRRAASTC